MKPLPFKRPSKDQREKLVLLGLVDLYIKTGKPVGSNTLRENGFEALSSATIRNYFGKLEEAGYLKQQHSSGGRIPTNLGYKLYADTHLHSTFLEEKERAAIASSLTEESKEVSAYLQKCAETISQWLNAAVILSTPRFDQDFVLDVKLVSLDNRRCLCILITDFGVVHTEILYTEKKLSSFTLKRIESFFYFKIQGLERPELTKEEEALATSFYNEVMLRHLARHNNFSAIDLHKTGFSKLLGYPDFQEDSSSLASGLAFFEDGEALRKVLDDTSQKNRLGCLIGSELIPDGSSCSFLITPYRVHQTAVGAIGVLGPSRIPYKHFFGVLRAASEAISECLTHNLYKFKISFRQPKAATLENKQEPFYFQGAASQLLLEDKTSEE